LGGGVENLSRKSGTCEFGETTPRTGTKEKNAAIEYNRRKKTSQLSHDCAREKPFTASSTKTGKERWGRTMKNRGGVSLPRVGLKREKRLVCADMRPGCSRKRTKKPEARKRELFKAA